MRTLRSLLTLGISSLARLLLWQFVGRNQATRIAKIKDARLRFISQTSYPLTNRETPLSVNLFRLSLFIESLAVVHASGGITKAMPLLQAFGPCRIYQYYYLLLIVLKIATVKA